MSWDEYFLDMVKLIANKSKDRSTKVGCVIVGEENEVRSTGFNGFCRGIDDEKEDRHERPAKYLWSEHAERNSIYNAAKIGISLNKCRIYISWWPCTDCSRAIIQAGIKKVIVDGRDSKEKYEFNKRWEENITVSKEMLLEAGIKLKEIN